MDEDNVGKLEQAFIDQGWGSIYTVVTSNFGNIGVARYLAAVGGDYDRAAYDLIGDFSLLDEEPEEIEEEEEEDDLD